MPGIQSTSSLPLDGSTSAVVPSPILISASESKFQSFPFYEYILHLMSTVFRIKKPLFLLPKRHGNGYSFMS